MNKSGIDFQFTVTEIKRLGKGLGMNLSLRMEGEYEGSGHCSSGNAAGQEPPARFPLHVVAPYDPTFGPVQIGQKFRLVKVEDELKPSRPACSDSACPLLGMSQHEFGPGCRLWKKYESR